MSKFVVFGSWEDVPHLSEEAKSGLIGSYQPHEVKARTKGIPSLGAGAIYPIDEQDVVCDPFVFPAWYKHSYGMDVGWNRTAAVWGATDPETDTTYLYAEHYRGQAEPPIHAAAIKARGAWIPGAIDPAARGRQEHDGTVLMDSYLVLGLKLVKADNAVESGLYQVWTRLSTGRLKVFRTLQNWLGEYRIYRRDEKGKIVKANDHLMDCTRYLVMTGLSLAVIRPPEEWDGRPGMPNMKRTKHQVDYNPFSSMNETPDDSYTSRY